MKISHLNIPVPDPTATRHFFETFFGLHCLEAKANALCVLTDEEGSFVFTLSNFRKNAPTPVYPQDFHLGFVRNSVQQVNDTYERLKSAGLEVEPPKKAHGAWAFYVTAPGDVSVEVSSYEAMPS